MTLVVFSPRFAIKLLEDVVFFVADVVNSGQPVLDVVMTKPNRERQKLMREQNILKQVEMRERGSVRQREQTNLMVMCVCLSRSLGSSRLPLKTGVEEKVHCCVWKNWLIRRMLPTSTCSDCVTGFCDTPRRTTVKTK